MAARAPLLTHREQTVHRAGDRAAQEQQIPLGIDPNHSEAELSEAAGAHMTPHPLALDDAGRIGPPGDRAGPAMAGGCAGFPAARPGGAGRPPLSAATPRRPPSPYPS